MWHNAKIFSKKMCVSGFDPQLDASADHET